MTNDERLGCIFSKRDSLIIFKDNWVGAWLATCTSENSMMSLLYIIKFLLNSYHLAQYMAYSSCLINIC